MKKENHEKEIKSTRVGGFGGSDAAMLVSIAERISTGQQLTTTQKHRVRVAKGIETPPPSFTSTEIEAGRAFEDEVAKQLDAEKWDRETFLTPKPNTSMAVRQHFRVFAHADFYNPKTNTVTECKWSRKFNNKGLQKEYRWQLQWYYMLGADAVCLCSDTADGREVSDITRKDKDVETLRNAVAVLDAAWDKLDLTITEFRPDELAPEILELYSEVWRLSSDIKDMTAKLEEKKSELLAWMEDHATIIDGEQCKINYSAASHSVVFDAKKFEADHADLFAAYSTKVTTRKAYLTVKIEK